MILSLSFSVALSPSLIQWSLYRKAPLLGGRTPLCGHNLYALPTICITKVTSLMRPHPFMWPKILRKTVGPTVEGPLYAQFSSLFITIFITRNQIFFVYKIYCMFFCIVLFPFNIRSHYESPNAFMLCLLAHTFLGHGALHTYIPNTVTSSIYVTLITEHKILGQHKVLIKHKNT